MGTVLIGNTFVVWTKPNVASGVSQKDYLTLTVYVFQMECHNGVPKISILKKKIIVES